MVGHHIMCRRGSLVFPFFCLYLIGGCMIWLTCSHNHLKSENFHSPNIFPRAAAHTYSTGRVSPAMDTLSSSVSTLKATNFNSTPREFCHLRTANRQRQLPPPSPQCFHFFSSTKASAISTNKSTSFSHKNLSTAPVFSTSSQASLPLTASSPYVHRKPASGYAAALLDIAQCNGSIDAVQQDAQRFSKLLQNSQIQALLTDPFLGDKEKGKAVKELVRKGKFNKHLVSLLKMLVEGNKLEMVTEVLEEFERIYDELSETKLVWILSQKKIGEDRLLRIAKRVQKLSGAVRVKNIKRLICNFLAILNQISLVPKDVMNQLKQSLAYTLKSGLEQNETQLLIIQFLQAPNIPFAHKLFRLIPNKTVFLYNKLIQAYLSVNQSHQCLALYSQMCLNNCSPSEHSFLFLFPACAALSSPFHGKILHTHFLKSGFGLDCYALTALLDMYAKLRMLQLARQLFDEMSVRNVPTWNALISGYSRFGDMKEALDLFKSMPERNVASWTSIISGYSQNGQFSRALDMFLRMEKESRVRPNRVTIASVLPACANLGALEVGERIEKYARENGLFEDLYVSNTVLEMYARCGKIEVAKRVFDEIGKGRNLCSWNSVIMGFALHGKSIEALEYYDQMLHEGTAPDDVTFVGVLVACTHGGLVMKGQEVFDSMAKKYNINPKLQHYGCMVDLLGRAGALQDAYDLIKSMPMKPDAVVWGALLGACSFHNNVELAEKAAHPLFQLEPWNAGNYVILSNIYASAGSWDRVAKLRKMMKGGQITKAAGYSFIEEGGGIHKFLVEDKSHPRCEEIYEILDQVSTAMKLQSKLIESESELNELLMMEQI